jgi:hypothetical protein
MSIGVRIKSEYVKFKDNIKYKLTTSPWQRLNDKIEAIYDSAIFQDNQAIMLPIINKDTSVINSICIENFNSKFIFFNSLFRSEIEIKDILLKRKTSLDILNDYVLNEFKKNIEYRYNEFGIKQEYYNLANTAKLMAISVLENELENILNQIEIYKTINCSKEREYLAQQNEVESLTIENKLNSISLEDVLVETKLEFNEEAASTIYDNNTIFKQDKFYVELFRILKENKIIDNSNTWLGLGKSFGSIRTQFFIFLIVLEKNDYLKNNVTRPELVKYFKDRFTNLDIPALQHYSSTIGKLFVDNNLNKDFNYYDAYSKFLKLIKENMLK